MTTACRKKCERYQHGIMACYNFLSLWHNSSHSAGFAIVLSLVLPFSRFQWCQCWIYFLSRVRVVGGPATTRLYWYSIMECQPPVQSVGSQRQPATASGPNAGQICFTGPPALVMAAHQYSQDGRRANSGKWLLSIGIIKCLVVVCWMRPLLYGFINSWSLLVKISIKHKLSVYQSVITVKGTLPPSKSSWIGIKAMFRGSER